MADSLSRAWLKVELFLHVEWRAEWPDKAGKMEKFHEQSANECEQEIGAMDAVGNDRSGLGIGRDSVCANAEERDCAAIRRSEVSQGR